jgi:hypothetical protein
VRTSFLFAALALLAGCGAPVPTPCGGGGSFGAAPAPPIGGVGGGPGTNHEPPGLSGRTLTMAFSLPGSFGCDGLTPSEGVNAEVLDPRNLKIESTATLPTTSTFDYRTTVSFEAARAGWYHFNVAFEPNLGMVQKDLLVAADRTGLASTELPTPVSLNCELLRRTQVGTVLCRSSSRWKALRSGGLEDISPKSPLTEGNEAAVVGNRVWFAQGSQLSVQEDDGSTFGTPLATTTLDARTQYPLALLPLGDEVTVVGNTGYSRYRLAGGLLTRVAGGNRDFDLDVLALLTSGGELLITSSEMNPDTAQTSTRLCTVTLPSPPVDEPAPTQCAVVAGTAVGMTHDGLWTFGSPETNDWTLRLYRPGPAPLAPFAALNLHLAFDARVAPGFEGQAPQLRFARNDFDPPVVFLPSLEADEVILERYELSGSPDSSGGNSTWVWSQGSTPKSLRVVRRP